MKLNITFEVYENGVFKEITLNKAKKLIESGKYYQTNEIHLGEATYLTPNEKMTFIFEKMPENEVE